MTVFHVWRATSARRHAPLVRHEKWRTQAGSSLKQVEPGVIRGAHQNRLRPGFGVGGTGRHERGDVR